MAKKRKVNKSFFNKYFLILIPVIIIGLLFTWLYQSKDIVMMVGSETVTSQELFIEIERLKPPDYTSTISKMEPDERKDAEESIRSKAIENLMKLKCVYLYAKENKIKVTQEDINNEIKKFEEQLKANTNSETIDLKATLADYGISWRSFTRDMRDQAIYNKVLDPVRNNVTSTDEELKEFYQSYAKYYNDPEKVHLKMISLSADKEKDADEIRDKLMNGEDFAKLAKEKSLSPDAAANGGDIGWLTKDELLKEISDNAFHPDVKFNFPYKIQARDGWYIFIVLERKSEVVNTFNNVKERVKNDHKLFKQNQAVDAFMLKLTDDYEQRIKLGNHWDNFLGWWDKIRGK